MASTPYYPWMVGRDESVNIQNGIRLGYQNTGLNFEYFTFTDDIVFFAKIERLQPNKCLDRTAGKTSL